MAVSPMSAEPHRRFLGQLVAGDLVNRKSKVVALGERDTVEQALEVLQQHKILSCPIRDASGKAPFLGILNLWDIVTAVCFSHIFDTYDGLKLDRAMLTDEVFDEALRLEVFKQPASELLGLSDESKTLWLFPWSTKVDGLLDAFSKGVHRVLIQGEGDDFRVLSQTDVVGYLLTHGAAELRALMDQPVSELGLVVEAHERKGEHPTITVPDDASALTGFRKLTLFQTSSVAVVNADNQIVGTLSQSDLRGLRQATFKLTLLPVMEFLAEVQGGRKPVISCKRTETLRTVMQRVLDGRVHRCWVVDDNNRLRGVITLTDVLCKFAPFDFKH